MQFQQDDLMWSYINDEGKLIGNENVWFIYFSNFYNGWEAVKRVDGKWNFINKNGKLIGNSKAWFDTIYNFYDTLTIVGQEYDYFYLDIKENLYDKNKNLIENLNDNETSRKAGLYESKTRYVRLTESELRQVIENIIESCSLIC